MSAAQPSLFSRRFLKPLLSRFFVARVKAALNAASASSCVVPCSADGMRLRRRGAQEAVRRFGVGDFVGLDEEVGEDRLNDASPSFVVGLSVQ